MPYDAKAIANYFLGLAERDESPLTPMKLQKLVYYANGWAMAILGEPLIDEQVEARDYGPVVPSLLREFQDFGNRPITRPAREWASVVEDDTYPIPSTVPGLEDVPEEAEVAREFLDRVWEVYGAFSAIQLSNMTHAPGTPWSIVDQRYGGRLPKGTDIPEGLIREHFDRLAGSPSEAIA